MNWSHCGCFSKEVQLNQWDGKETDVNVADSACLGEKKFYDKKQKFSRKSFANKIQKQNKIAINKFEYDSINIIKIIINKLYFEISLGTLKLELRLMYKKYSFSTDCRELKVAHSFPVEIIENCLHVLNHVASHSPSLSGLKLPTN